MKKEIEVRKPRKWAFSYKKRREKWKNSLPSNGDFIRITWLPDNNGMRNAYIGFSGVVENMNKETGYFVLRSSSSILICSRNFKYEKI